MFRRAFQRLCSKTLASGVVLTGDFNKETGNLVSGVAKMPDGRVFSGKFDSNDGTPLAKSQLEEDGDLYIGDFNKQWQRCGDGEAWLGDGTHYKGSFKDDELVAGEVRIPQGAEEVHFSGTLRDEEFVKGTLKQTGFTYTGEFKSNMPHGKGLLEYTTGAVLEGTFRNGALHGDNGKLKLESGWVYIGSFENGAIYDGELRTPMYTYEGKFNRSGKAHGEGTQIQLVTEPKLIFTGIWVEGQMAQGTVVDEYGAPVDYQNRPDLQEQIKKPDEMQMENYAMNKIGEARANHKQRDEDYMEDAKRVLETTGKFPSRGDLGYEPSTIREGQEAMQAATRSDDHIENTKKVKAQAAHVGEQRSNVAETMSHVPEGSSFNPHAATQSIMSQNSANASAAENVKEQLARYAKKASSAGDSKKGAEGLNIDSNASWSNAKSI